MTDRPTLALVPARPFAPSPCPSWCDSPHAERDVDPSLACHSAQLTASTDRVVTVWIQQTEDDTASEAVGLGIDTGPRDLSGLTPDQIDGYAATLHRAAMRARAILNGADQ